MKNYVNILTGEFVETKQVQPVTVVQPEKKFQTRYNYIPLGTPEKNSGDYIIDDSQYIDFKKLLQRSAACSKESVDFLSSIPVVDNVGGIDEKDLDDIIKGTDTIVSVDKSNDLSTSTPERPQEASVGVNLEDKEPDASDKSEADG